jgi:putative transposase
VWLDATFHKIRELDRVVSVATVVAIGCTDEGARRVLGVDCGPPEDEAFWMWFLRSLVKRGLKASAWSCPTRTRVSRRR